VIRILLADDDARLLKTLEGLLSGEGYGVIACESGSEALERALSDVPHLAILDHYMPGMTGREVCLRLRELGAPARVILLTSESRVEQRVAGLDAGADDYILKPFDPDELLARVRAQVRRVKVELPPQEALQSLVDGLRDRDKGVREAAAAGIGRAGGALCFRVLGDLQVTWHGIDVGPVLWYRRQPKALMKLLLLQYERVVSGDAMMDAIWPDLTPDAARANLHVNIQRLRSGMKPFGAERVETVEGGYVLRLRPEDTLDLLDFDRASEEAGRALAAGGVPRDHAERLSELFRGEVLADDPYAEWVIAPRQRVRATFEDILARTAAGLRREGEHGPAAELLRRLLELDPTSEDHAADLADCLLELGDRASAMTVLDRVERHVAEELDAAPGPRVIALRRRLSQAD